MPTPARTSPETHLLAAQLAARLLVEAPALAAEFAPFVRKLDPCRHGPDFACVLWWGRSYSFTGTQAAVVRQLWEAWQNGTPDVRQETLLAGAESETRRLGDTFKDHPAWGTLIVGGGAKGCFRLNDAISTSEQNHT